MTTSERAKRACSVAAILAATGCGVAEPTTRAQAQAQVESDDTASARFTYEDLVALIQERSLTSIEQLLPALPEDLRASYVLLHESRSLQGASFAFPRAVLFGIDARLTCAFAGDPAAPGFDSLECFQFREQDRAFDFRQIRFPTPENGLDHVVFSAPNRSTDGTIRCATCHGADPRPNWDDYDRWPGAYGTEDDTLEDDAPRYADFVARRATDARYRWLVQGPTPTDPYMSGDAIGIENRPNLRFSDACGRMNALRATRLLARSGKSLAFAVAALKCRLSPEQSAALTQAGIDPQRELDLDAIFAAAGITSDAWGTQIFDDPSQTSSQPWEHQAGFTFLSIDVGMSVAQDLGRAGNVALQQGVAHVAAYTTTRFTGSGLRFYSALDEIVPDPDFFGGHFSDNTDAICPALTEAFIAAELHP